MGSTQSTTTAEGTAAASVDPKLHERFEAIRQKGEKVAEKSRANAQSRMEATAYQLDETAAQVGDSKISHRLSAEFNTTADALIEQKSELGVSWGQLTIANTLAANSKSGLTASQLLEMKHEGTGWGVIAAGLGFDLNGAVKGVKAEGRVASGLDRADGKVAVIRGEGARAGADASLGAGVRTGNAGAGVGLGAGIKLGH
jgi:hypothetical protein